MNPDPDPQAAPAFLAPGFRLFEGGATFLPDALRAAAATLDPVATAWGSAILCPAGASVQRVLAGLLAAERQQLPLLLARGPVPDPASGLSGRLPAAPPPGPGLTVALSTSGTTGPARWIWHDWQRLCGRIRLTPPPACWLLTYEPASFAGLQVILTAALSGAGLVALPPQGPVSALCRILAAAGSSGDTADHPPITHSSGTPSFWRAVLISIPEQYRSGEEVGGLPALRHLTLGGEIADTPTLTRLAAAFPAAKIRHLYASTEAGALFAVSDGRAGFPASWLETGIDEVSLRIRNDILEVRSPRMMTASGECFGSGLNLEAEPSPSGPRLSADGWLITGDQVRQEGDRVLFRGRADSRVNIGGVKVWPEAVEAALLAVPGVAEAWVSVHTSPVTGHLLTAQVVPLPEQEPEALRQALRQALEPLPAAARPRRITVVAALPVTLSGKKQRS